MTSPTSGRINLGEEQNQSFSQVFSRNTLHIPDGHVVMISFSRYSALRSIFLFGLKLFTVDQNDSEITLWSADHHDPTDVYLYDVNTITILLKRSTLPVPICMHQHCFTMLFSFHAKSSVPNRLRNDLFNCSVGDYWRFQQHLDCNLKVECEDGRDETGHCPFSSPACQGWVASRGKCYMFVSPENLQTFKTDGGDLLARVVKYCDSVNGSLGQPKDVQDMQILWSAFRTIKRIDRLQILVGWFYHSLYVPSLYRGSVVTADKTVLHHTVNKQLSSHEYTGETECLLLITHTGTKKSPTKTVPCSSLHTAHEENSLCATCEFLEKERAKPRVEVGFIQLPTPSFRLTRQKQNLTLCSDGQVTHTFLSRDPHHVCEKETIALRTMSHIPLRNNSLLETGTRKLIVSVFTCDDGGSRLSYTLVCDFRHDCQDGRDESFCKHPPCDAFTCTNGQCVSYSKHCDMISHCLDHSDEQKCIPGQGIRRHKPLVFRSPVLVQFDSTGLFTVKNMSVTQPCPVTHYRCPGEYNDCLPVYTQCNGWYDCMGHEDEEGCEKRACPGFYRCFTSTVCVHADHMCDGWPQCPQRDDEWLCDMTCPAQCLCQGHAFLCPQPFPAHFFPQLRYLDARGSGMTPADLTVSQYIVALNLSLCSLTTLPVMNMQNLHVFDLSDNYLHIANMSLFAGLANLRTLILAGNPIRLMHSEPITGMQQSSLRAIDLSHTNLTVFDTKPLSAFLHVQTLNLSFSSIQEVGLTGFTFTPQLTSLYMEGTALQTFPADVLRSLSYLRIVTSDTYKLCCKQILPDRFEWISCTAPRNEISSCEDLLQSGTYRVFLWLISFLSLLGNVLCLMVRVCVQRGMSTRGFHVFVTNLCMADLLMGVYIVIIGVADELFRGKYLFMDTLWTHSVACKVAGFLSLLSCEVSALIIFLITLDRFVVLHFPFSSVRFQRTSATVACLFTWLVGWVLASIPLVPMTSHWEFFSQTGICIPLPVTRQGFKGRVYSVSVFIILNFVLFIFIATGQAFIYWTIERNTMRTDRTNISRDLTVARRLVSVAVTDFLCWFPIGLCGLLASTDVPIPSEVNVGLAIFVLPLNSALNPFMYTFNTVMEKRKKFKEAALLKRLELDSDLLNERLDE